MSRRGDRPRRARRAVRALLAAALGLLAVPAAAKEMEFVVIDAIGDGPVAWIEARGEIVGSTPARLETLLKARADAGISHILLSSSGGSLGPALEVGRIIRKYRLVATIPADGVCTSACAYAFLGGVARNFQSIGGDAPETAQKRLGFHSFAFDMSVPAVLSGSGATGFADRVAQNSQVTAGGLADYVAAMGVNVDIIRQAAAHGRTSYLFLPIAELKSLGILSDYEKDLGDFRLIPDQGGLTAVFIHEDHQFTVACHRLGGSAPRPVFVFSQAFGPTPDSPQHDIVVPIKLSAISGLTGLAWTARDLEHKHFHAHDWIKSTDWNPVFGFLSYNEGDDDPKTVVLDQSNSAFYAQGEMFHAVVALSPEIVKSLLGTKDNYLSLHEHRFGEGWAHKFTNDERDREVLSYALRSCQTR